MVGFSSGACCRASEVVTPSDVTKLSVLSFMQELHQHAAVIMPDWAALAEALSSVPPCTGIKASLTRLVLTGRAEEHMIDTFNVLEQLPSLRYLVLSHVDYREVGQVCIIEAARLLRKLSDLETLTLAVHHFFFFTHALIRCGIMRVFMSPSLQAIPTTLSHSHEGCPICGDTVCLN